MSQKQLDNLRLMNLSLTLTVLSDGTVCLWFCSAALLINTEQWIQITVKAAQVSAPIIYPFTIPPVGLNWKSWDIVGVGGEWVWTVMVELICTGQKPLSCIYVVCFVFLRLNQRQWNEAGRGNGGGRRGGNETKTSVLSKRLIVSQEKQETQ